MTADEQTLPTAPSEADAYLAKAFRALVAREPLDGVLHEIVEAALAGTRSGAAVLSRLDADGCLSAAGATVARDAVPALALPVVTNGRATHTLSLYSNERDHRLADADLDAAWRFATLAGIVLSAEGTEPRGVRAAAESDETGILARHGFEADVTAALELHDGCAGLTIVRVCDLDRINQQWGREVGDEVLRLVARAMLDALGGAGTVGRLRRHEFGAVVPGADYVETEAIAGKIRSLVAQPLPVLGVNEVWAVIAIGAAAATGTTRSVTPLLHSTYRAVDDDERLAQRAPRSARYGF